MIYLDNNATTRPAPHVVASMLPYLTECYFNASASTAAFTGADKPRRDAASAIAKLLNAEEPECFAFTSGATESNNWVLSSLLQAGAGQQVVISAIEHSSISEPAAALARRGFQVIEIPVDEAGVIRLDALRDSLNAETALVSIMAANNETGVLQPIPDIGRLVRDHCPSSLFHTDATQAVGKIPIDLRKDWHEVDYLSFSAHKYHGPKGIGGLYIRPGCSIPPIIMGGGQEQGLRSGTTNTPSLAGLAAAATDPKDLLAFAQISQLRDQFERELQRALPSVVIHSASVSRLPNTSCFSLPGIIGEDIAHSLARNEIIVGTGSACSSGSIHPPKTLLAMGIDYNLASSTIRISMSSDTTQHELTTFLAALTRIVSGDQCESVR